MKHPSRRTAMFLIYIGTNPGAKFRNNNTFFNSSGISRLVGGELAASKCRLEKQSNLKNQLKFWIIIPQNNVLVISDYNTKLLLMVCYCMFIGVRGECVIRGCVACFLVMGGGELEMKN